ncbi:MULTISPECIES: TolC family protein [Butyricimonas]|uniref:TolC family protein n=1 Tax=Butyricimonas TaxID=574697 RepID=UPI001D07E7A4|nr:MULTISPECIES: TolC family protein [Butyricimonas]MCB6972374.1 TolC family protein [Butyricimonas synergistica]MCG4519382.1 TolC family protein [Butyricimonas sp. DFI.6.44]
MDTKYIIIGCLLFLNLVCLGQNRQNRDSILNVKGFVPQALTTSEFIDFQLPLLDSLFEGAQKNPRIKEIESAIEAARNDLKIAKRDWWQYFTVRAGYTYGILGTYTDQETQYTQLTTVYSGINQSSWTVGANISIPFNRLFSHRASVKKQKELVRSSEYTKQIKFDEIKNEIIELYCNIQYQLKLLKLATESITLYNAEYQVAELDYINNKTKNSDRTLSDFKHSQKVAKIEYENIINELNIMFLKLELISNMHLRNK